MHFCACAGQTGLLPLLRESGEVWRSTIPGDPPSTCSNEVVHQGVVVISTQE